MSCVKFTERMQVSLLPGEGGHITEDPVLLQEDNGDVPLSLPRHTPSIPQPLSAIMAGEQGHERGFVLRGVINATKPLAPVCHLPNPHPDDVP